MKLYGASASGRIGCRIYLANARIAKNDCEIFSRRDSWREEEEGEGEVAAAEEEEGTRVRSSIYHPPERIEVNHPERLERREEFKFYQGARKTRKINYHS